MMSQLGQTRQSVSAAYFFPLSLLLFFSLSLSSSSFSLFPVFSVTDLELFRQELRPLTFFCHPKWVFLCYQKQLLAYCSGLCCIVLPSLQQVHPITVFFLFFPCLCLGIFIGSVTLFSFHQMLSIFHFLVVFILFCVDITPFSSFK